MNLASGLGQCLINRLVQSALDQQVRTLRINADAGKIRPISNAAQPSMKFRKVEIGAQKAGNDDDRGAIATRHAQAVVHRCCVQDEYLSPEQGLGPQRGIGFGVAPRRRRTPLRGGRTRCCFFLFTRQVRPWVCLFSASRRRRQMLHCNIVPLFVPLPNTFLHLRTLDGGYRLVRGRRGLRVGFPSRVSSSATRLRRVSTSDSSPARGGADALPRKRFIMQALEGHIEMRWQRPWFWPFRKMLVSRGDKVPTYIPRANQFARTVAQVAGGTAMSILPEILFDVPGTAHCIGGCVIADSPDRGVVDDRHRVFGYRNMYICDGSVLAANLGVNPSLTITALAERAMSFIPPAAETTWSDAAQATQVKHGIIY